MPGEPAAEQQGGRTGVIHDIGYRHYDGPRAGRGPIVRSLFVDTLRGAFGLGRSTRSKIAPFLLLGLACLPALVIAVVVNVTKASAPLFPTPDYLSYIYALVVLYVGGQAPAAVSRDLRYRVTTLYFSRPLRRTDYVAAKFAALTTAIAIVLTLPLAILLGGLLLSDVPRRDSLLGFGQGLVAVALLAPMLAGISLVIASVTPRRGLGAAAVVAVLTIVWALQGVLRGILDAQGHESVAYWTQLCSPSSVVDGVVAWTFGIDSAGGVKPTGAPVLFWWAYVVVVVGGCLALLLARYRKVSVT